MSGILNDSSLHSLTIKNIQVVDCEDTDQLEIQILNAFSVPKYNQLIFKNLKKLDISICQSQRNLDLAISEESFSKK